VGALPTRNSSNHLAGILVPAAASGLLVLFARRRAARWLGLGRACILLALALALFSLISCGGGAGLTGAVPGTITLSINGSGTTPSGDGSVTATVPLTVTIQ